VSTVSMQVAHSGTPSNESLLEPPEHMKARTMHSFALMASMKNTATAHFLENKQEHKDGLDCGHDVGLFIQRDMQAFTSLHPP